MEPARGGLPVRVAPQALVRSAHDRPTPRRRLASQPPTVANADGAGEGRASGMLIDLPLAELREYRPDVLEPDDFDEFWAGELAEARERDAEPRFTEVATPIRHARIFDVMFAGAGGDSIKGWLLVPRETEPDAALVVEYVGYNGGRGDPLDWLTYSCAGHPHFVMDTRGQGGGWRSADTFDPRDNGAPSTNGFLTRGIAEPRTHYYARTFVDAARAVDAARRHPVAAGRATVCAGVSQGGGLALAASHLVGDVDAVLPDVPFPAHPRRAVELTDSRPYREVIEYCSVHSDRVDDVFRTLSYMDVVNHAKRVTAPALFSVGLIDEVTPASTVFAAYNHYAGPKDIAVYQFNGHEGGSTRHLAMKLAFLDARRAGTTPA
jgi:cephalosporin-C deacetylase